MPASGSAHFFGDNMQVYFDESGDLGWTFHKPYKHGGSSRYLTIAFLFIDESLKHIPKRIMRTLYRKRKRARSKELKGSQLKDDEKEHFIIEIQKMLNKNPAIKLAAITVKKENVFNYIREDKNLLYNYMTKLIIPDYIKKFKKVDMFPDPRSIKVKSANSLKDYLQTFLWFELRVETKLYKYSITSDNNLNIQFSDVLANIIWESYEYQKTANRNKLLSMIDNRELFF